MAIGPPTGMRDWLPQETLLRQRLMETIGSVYQLYGYLPIDTPANHYGHRTGSRQAQSGKVPVSIE